MTKLPWHRVFHPLCGADPITLARLVAKGGLPGPRGYAAFAVACASAAARLPFTLAEAAIPPRPPAEPPVFIVGHPRSGTTHLHNLVAASGAFVTVPPVPAGMPWEARSLAPVLRPFIDPYLPATRLIDGVALTPDAPTEDEVALANMCALSYFHALYTPRRFRALYRAGLLLEAPEAERAARGRALGRYVAAMSRRGGRAARGRPLLLKNPAYTARVGWLAALFPGARIVHIHRDPRAVFASTRRAVRTVLRELALQAWDEAEIDAAILETYPLMMEGLRAEAAGLPEGRFAEVAFEDLAADPVPVLRDLWARLDLPEAAAAPGRIEDYLATIRGYRPARNRLTGEETATLDALWGRELADYGRPGA